MKSKRLRNYLKANGSNKSVSFADIGSINDGNTDADFPGFPNGASTPSMITPITESEKKLAAVDIKDGDKMTREEIADAQNKVATSVETNAGENGNQDSAEIKDQHQKR